MSVADILALISAIKADTEARKADTEVLKAKTEVLKDHLNSIFLILMGKRLPYEPIWINYISILLD